MTAIAQWKAEMRSLLTELNAVFEERFCYPPGDNMVADADVGELERIDMLALPAVLAAFYAEVGELSIPDVHNGYFILPLDMLNSRITRALPTRVEIEIDGQPLNDDVVSFGADGGGGFFCMSRSNGAIYYLPVGRVDKIGENNVYSGGLCDPEFVVPSFEAFLQRILTVTKGWAIDGVTGGILDTVRFPN
jgi:hypothetical protein